MKTRFNVARTLFVIALVTAFLTTVVRLPVRTVTAKDGKNEPKISYPESKKVDQVDDYFGTKVADPYRWLEDENSAETKAWVQAQNAVTFAYLDKIPYREKLKARLTELYNYPRVSAPFHRGDTYFFTKNDGLQNQNVYYIQKGVNGKPKSFSIPISFLLTAPRR